MKYEPLNSYIIIRPLGLNEKKGSLYLPLNMNLNYRKGEVLASSKSVDQVKAGDIVLYYKRGVASENVDLDGVAYDIVREDGLMLNISEG